MGTTLELEGQLEVFDPNQFAEDLRIISVEFYRQFSYAKLQSLTPEAQERLPSAKMGKIKGVDYCENPICPGCIDAVADAMMKFPAKAEEIKKATNAFLTTTTGSDWIDRRNLKINAQGANFLLNAEENKRIFWSMVAVRLVEKYSTKESKTSDEAAQVGKTTAEEVSKTLT